MAIHTTMISLLPSNEVRVEARILFRLELPSHKSIGVKAKQGKTVAEVILIMMSVLLLVMIMFVILMTSIPVGNVDDHGDLHNDKRKKIQFAL